MERFFYLYFPSQPNTMLRSIFLLICLLFTKIITAQNLNLVGHLSYNGTTTAGVWHYVDSLNNEYAIVGAGDRVSIVDVTNPSAPVEVFNIPCIPGQNSTWRELKITNQHAYAVSEGGGGVINIDLSHLPDSVSYSHWYGDSTIANQLERAHTIDASNGYIYIFGNNIGNGGCVIADVSDPYNPHYVGIYNDYYIHDGYVRNDTLWAMNTNLGGSFSVIDVADKSNPVLLVSHPSPAQLSHNVWLSDNSQYAFTTDEVNGAFVAAFDVSDLSNITLVGSYYPDSLPNDEVHNVRILNDYMICPSYGSEITVVDVARPQNPVEIARAPTDFGSGISNLCWDASPYLPSGNIIAADVDGGLFIFQPNYHRACYLEGNVTDSISGAILNNVQVEILTTIKTIKTNLLGDYKTGTADSGLYDVQFTHPGYYTKIYTGISLTNGTLTTLNAELSPFIVSGTVTDGGTSAGINHATIYVDNGAITDTTSSDSTGNFSFTNLTPGLYTITVAKWGYMTYCTALLLNGSATISLFMFPGYSDDFTTDNGWTVTSTCTTGDWVRGVPAGTMFGALHANVDHDILTDCNNKCFVTGNGGGTANTDDIDDGETILTSPAFDLTSYSNPYIIFSTWYFNNPTVSATSVDTLLVTVDNGIDTIITHAITLNNTNNGAWSDYYVPLWGMISFTNNMHIHIKASDKPLSGNICEAGFDNFSIVDVESVSSHEKNNQLKVFPNPFTDQFVLKTDATLFNASSLVQVTDVTGRTIFTSPLTSPHMQITLSNNILPGVYFISVSGDDVPVSKAVIVKH